MIETCGYANKDGSPCENLVSGSTSICAAGHPVTRSTPRYAPLPDDSHREGLAEAPGVVSMENALYGPLPADADDAEMDGAGF